MAANASGIRAGRAFVELGAKDAKLLRALKRAQQRLQAFGAGLKSIGLRVAAVGGAVVTAGLGMARIFAGMGDEVHKMALRTGFSTEALSELGLAAELSGADLATLENGIRKMQKSIGDAGRGLSTQVEALQKLGLTYDELSGLSPEKQFELIADRLSGIEDPTQRAAVAMDLFGRSGTKLLPLMKDGAAGMEAMRKQARDLGLTISQEDADAAALLTDTLTEMWRVVKQSAFAIGSALAPTLIAAARTVTQVVVAAMGWIKENKALVLTIFKVGAAVLAAGTALVALGTGILAGMAMMSAMAGAASLVGSVLSAVFGVVGALLAALISPLGIVAVAVGTLASIFIDWGAVVDDTLSWAVEKFQWLKGAVTAVVGGISDALASGNIALAAEILWKSLKLAWLQGTQKLREIWFALKKSFVISFHELVYAITRTWLDGAYTLRTAWIKVTSWLSRIWTEFTSGFQKAWNTAINWTTKRLIELWGLFDDTIDVKVAQQMADEELAEANAKIDDEKRKALDANEAEKKSDLNEAKSNYDARVAEAEQALMDAAGKALDEQKEAIKNTTAELEAARKALKDALTQARSERAAAEKDEGPARRRTDYAGAGSFDEWSQGVQQKIAAGATVVGTFNIAALQGLGYSGAQERTAKATEETARNTKRLIDDARHNRATFT